MLDGKKILIYDDPDTIEDYKRYLERIDAFKNTTFFYSDNEGMTEEIIDKEKPDLLFLSGLVNAFADPVLTRLLKKYAKTYKTMTISWEKTNVTTCLELGSKWHFIKPCGFDEILVIWKKFLD